MAPIQMLRIDLAAAIRWEAGVNMHQSIASHLSSVASSGRGPKLREKLGVCISRWFAHANLCGSSCPRLRLTTIHSLSTPQTRFGRQRCTAIRATRRAFFTYLHRITSFCLLEHVELLMLCGNCSRPNKQIAYDCCYVSRPPNADAGTNLNGSMQWVERALIGLVKESLCSAPASFIPLTNYFRKRQTVSFMSRRIPCTNNWR
jgi:hypothetical protein